MAFDTATRNELQRMVGAARECLVDEFTTQCQRDYGIQPDGSMQPLGSLGHLDEDQRVRAALLRERAHHIAAGLAGKTKDADTVKRLVRDQAFTVLNRLCALRMCEERGLLQECVRGGYESKGFRLFGQATARPLGATYERYRLYLELLYDELAVDLGVLFDRYSLHGLLFPGENALKATLEFIDAYELAHVWAEDEAIGWVYQYFNSEEERRRMRQESSAPRNSRELAVRNQFFTPRYVVEFLTDNTLGRIWYEMRKGETELVKRCRYLLRCSSQIFLAAGEPFADDEGERERVEQAKGLTRSMHIAHRQRKDPRDLKVLDPAAGSGHFLLYAYDLLEIIYEEAWADPEAPSSEKTGKRLSEDYSTIQALRRALPALILRYNLWGVDIDPRAVQIAALALWLRAQRAWQNQRLTLYDPSRRVAKSNIVTAEPMPGERQFLEEFTGKLRPRVLGQLVETVFEEMRLAGEAGSLLKIERELQAAISTARQEWVCVPQVEMDTEVLGVKEPQGAYDLTGVTDAVFWEDIETAITDALEEYAEKAQSNNGLSRRLFVDDAVQGFGFVDLCRQNFDVVLMNPPFGNPSANTKEYLQTNYPTYGGDLLTAFISRTTDFSPTGRTGAIVSRAPFYLPTYGNWRAETLFLNHSLTLALDLGANVLDSALVETLCVVLDATGDTNATVVRLNRTDPPSRGRELVSQISQYNGANTTSEMFHPDIQDLTKIPGMPFVYSVARQLRRLFEAGKSLSPNVASVEQGLSTKNDFRYLRLATEVPPTDIRPTKWGYLAKGGEYRPYFDDIYLVVKAHFQFAELAADLVAKYPYLKGNPAWVLHPEAQYLKGGLTYPERTTSGFSPRILPENCYFSHVGLAIICDNHDAEYEVLAWLLSRPVQLQIEVQAGSADAVESGSAARHYSKSLISNLRIPEFGALRMHVEAVKRIAQLIGASDLFEEVTSRFVCPWHPSSLSNSVRVMGRDLYDWKEQKSLNALETHATLEEVIESIYWGEDRSVLDDEVRTRLAQLPMAEPDDDLLRQAYTTSMDGLVDLCVDIVGAHRSISKKTFVCDRRLELTSVLCQTQPTMIAKHRKMAELYPPKTDSEFAKRLVSYCVGVVFGRWELSAATSNIEEQIAVDPMATLQPISPGMKEFDYQLAVHSKTHEYPRGESQVIISDIRDKDSSEPSSESEFNICVSGVIEQIWPEQWEHVEQEIEQVLGVSQLGRYLGNPSGFFADHLARYTRSRRKAPIYWPLSTESGSYTLWVYYPRLTDQTLYECVNEHVDPKLKEIGADTRRVRGKGASDRDVQDRLGDLEELRREMQMMRNELLRVAALPYKPNQNDGVLITAAPLWKLIPHRAWRRELQKCWKALESGDYDWAHLALSLWPDRVREKCRNDKSIAIAHELENLYEVG